MTILPKVMPALVTPFTETGEVDLGAHAHNVETMFDRGARGLLIAGSTGEGPYLEPGERGALVAQARVTNPSMTIVCGINAETERTGLAQIGEATDAGADAVLVITPTTLVRGRDHLVETFYERLASLCDLPILLYSVPGVTGWALPTDTVNHLAGTPEIIGMKDSGGQPDRLSEIGLALDSGFIVFAGKSRALTESMSKGAFGAITASANYALDDVEASVRGDVDGQARLVATTAVIEPHGVPATKFAAGLTGLRPGHARRPLRELPESARYAIKAALNQGIEQTAMPPAQGLPSA